MGGQVLFYVCGLGAGVVVRAMAWQIFVYHLAPSVPETALFAGREASQMLRH